STQKTAVIMDDLVPWRSYGAGPTKAWDEAVQDGVIRQEEFFQDGESVKVAQAPGDRAWALGHYIF
ncbi:MAG TPA: hypothetical protein VHW60_08595, partial [Caulobacteraceae bacterium]|nr:hypothetical protein [Caulobacteraceae bacterium]